MTPTKNNHITDVPGFIVGNAHDTKVKTGVTVVTSDRPFTASVHVMGGAPGTRETDLLAPDRTVQQVDALVLSGGSSFGLDAASGVADALATRGRGFAVGNVRVPIVPAAILFDLLNGGMKEWALNPYRALGIDALNAAGRNIELGAVGAGFGATTATARGGLGSATLVLDTGITIGALVAVNAIGSALVPNTEHYWAAAYEVGDEFGGRGPCPTAVDLQDTFVGKQSPRENTTLAIVATDACLSQAQITRVATAAHDGIARALVPAHTPFDGDLVFGAASGKSDVPVTDALISHLGHAASICVARAIARGVFLANP